MFYKSEKTGQLIPFTSVLFACTYNSVRSPMAETLMKNYHGYAVYVDSAGVINHDLHPLMQEVMAERGYQHLTRNSKSFEDLRQESFDLIIALSDEAYQKALDYSKIHACMVERWNIPEPMTDPNNLDRFGSLEQFRTIREMLLDRILKLFV